MKATGATSDELAAACRRELPHERAWRVGAEGEARLGARLNEGSAAGCYAVLHDLTSPDRGRSNIDHLVVGPAGIWVVDCKAWTGTVQVRPRGLFHGRHGKRRELAGVAGQVECVRTALAAEGRGDVPVRGLICLVNDNLGLPASVLVDIDGVGVGGQEAVLHAVSSGTTYDALGVCALHAVVERRFTTAGGSVLPPLTSLAPDTLLPAGHAAPPSDVGRAASRPPKRPARWLLRGLLGRSVKLAPLAVVGVVGFSQLDALESMSRDELREQRPALRVAAERRAGGEVRGPRVLEAPGTFRLVYRRGRRCRVVVRVDRSSPVFAAAEKGTVTVSSTGCRRASRR